MITGIMIVAATSNYDDDKVCSDIEEMLVFSLHMDVQKRRESGRHTDHCNAGKEKFLTVCPIRIHQTTM